jgi:hypothetical protein
MTDKGVKTFQHSDGEIGYFMEYNKEKGTILIRIINKLLCEEYSDIFDNLSTVFNGHTIINNSSILFDIFVNHFKKDDKRIKLEFENLCEHSKNAEDCKKYIVRIELNLEYISDNMTFELQHTNKQITPQQVVEGIDYRFDTYLPTVESKMGELIEQIDATKIKPIIEEMERLKRNFDELQKQCESLLKSNEELYNRCESSKLMDKHAMRTLSPYQKQC